LVGLCNTPHNVERYVTDPKTFMGYQIKVLQFNSIFLAMNNTLRIANTKNDLAYGILHNNQIRVLISLEVFGRVMQYPINCQNICDYPLREFKIP
jgi:hypothetical protein